MTNLDLHDIARACRTYGVRRYYVVTPLADQAELIARIVDHWTAGAGRTYNPARSQALGLIRVAPTFAAAVDDIAAREGERPTTVATTARRRVNAVRFRQVRTWLSRRKPVALVFGTAWGLCDAFMADMDYTLDALTGVDDYNHLSVRSAAAIVLDRLMGGRDGAA